ncbi:MAG TPA: endonuclease domain-containing protein [Stellaceae bacterium]|nr:endonuclease domain-containing protein [Stellaceae bacterium]
MTDSTFARRLRRDMTEAEKIIWRLLRARQLAGYTFRRQEPIGRYIVDFVCFQPRLVVEIDGGQHADPTRYEEERTGFLEREGFRVLRFWNNEVLENREGVCLRILEVLALPPHLPGAARRAPPSPTRGEGT